MTSLRKSIKAMVSFRDLGDLTFTWIQRLSTRLTLEHPTIISYTPLSLVLAAQEIDNLKKESEALKSIRAHTGKIDFSKLVFEKVFDEWVSPSPRGI